MTSSPHPIDVYVGSRVRLQRMIRKVSQEKLGEMLKLTFQQVQKYEKGTNRISASRLYQIAAFLDVPIEFFFEGAEFAEFSKAKDGENDDRTGEVMAFVKSTEGLQLNLAFSKIDDDNTRKAFVELVKTLA